MRMWDTGCLHQGWDGEKGNRKNGGNTKTAGGWNSKFVFCGRKGLPATCGFPPREILDRERREREREREGKREAGTKKENRWTGLEAAVLGLEWMLVVAVDLFQVVLRNLPVR